MQGRNNSFDLLRHFAALLVLYSHQFPLSGLIEPNIPYWNSYGFVAVCIFFAISGFLMPSSFNNAGNFVAYMGRRCRRIFPALIICTFLMVYVIGIIFTSTPKLIYLTSIETLKTSFSILSLLDFSIPGIFTNFIFPGNNTGLVNGSLWTLTIEFAWYILFGLALSFVRSWKTVLVLFLCSMIGCMIQNQMGINYFFYGISLGYFVTFGMAFTSGALLAMTQKHWLPIRGYLAFLALLLLFLLPGRPEINVLGTLSIALLTIIIGTSFKDKLINGRFDISYGIYIYAFPIQQIVINVFHSSFWLGMCISAICSIIAGYLSYRFIEKPFLLRSKFKSAFTEYNFKPGSIDAKSGTA